MENNSVLYIVSIPIGDPDDITLRAIRVLRETDILLCEEYRNGSRLLKQLDIPEKEMITINEHNEMEQIDKVMIQMAQGKSCALVSDCGTPLFSDPGHRLVAQISAAGFRIIPVPGVSSLAAVISVTPVKLERYIFAGFLPRVPEERINTLKKLKMMKLPIILMDTPYRLGTLLGNIKSVFGKGQTITLAANLTLPNEWIITGSVQDICIKAGSMKAEFMLVIHQA